MRSKLRASRLLASVVAASTLVGGAAFGATGVAGAQTDDGEGPSRPPAEAGPGRGHGPKLDAAAEALNLSVEDLREQLRDGRTLAQVAQEQNVDVQRVIDAMVAAATERIDEEVQEGDLTAEEGNERKANLEERITRLVNEGPQRGGPGHRRGPKLDAAAEALNLSVEDLRQQLRDGRTLAQVAQEQNVDVQTVIDAMVADATARIDQKVQEGELSAEEANEHKAELEERITRLVNEGPPERGERGERGEGPPPEPDE
jgi:alkylated DNA nucleotide flippase Atl1